MTIIELLAEKIKNELLIEVDPNTFTRTYASRNMKAMGAFIWTFTIISSDGLNTISEMLAYNELRDIISSNTYEDQYRNDLSKKAREVTTKYGCYRWIYKRRFKIEELPIYSKYFEYCYLSRKSDYKAFQEILDKIDNILSNGLETVVEQSINSELEKVYKDLISKIPDNFRDKIKITISN